MMWTHVIDGFMKQDKPYGMGDFRIKGNTFISMKLTEPEIKFHEKTEAELKNSDGVAQVTEPWMDNVTEIANRSTVRFFNGTLDNSAHAKIMEMPAQFMSWWVSDDWRTIILGTDWRDLNKFDMYNPDAAFPERYNAAVFPDRYKLFKSTDYGHTWQPLKWLGTDANNRILFANQQLGYIVGEGPIVRRTINGGYSWYKVQLPPLALDAKDSPGRSFDMTYVDSKGTLWFSVYTKRDIHHPLSSLVYSIGLNDSKPTFRFALPQMTAVDLKIDASGRVFLLVNQGLPQDVNIPGDGDRKRPNAVLMWDGKTLHTLKTFNDNVRALALYQLKNGTLAVDATIGDVMTSDALFVSHDSGESWDKQDEGGSAEGMYFNPQTGERWRVSIFGLYKRVVE